MDDHPDVTDLRDRLAALDAELERHRAAWNTAAGQIAAARAAVVRDAINRCGSQDRAGRALDIGQARISQIIRAAQSKEDTTHPPDDAEQHAGAGGTPSA